MYYSKKFKVICGYGHLHNLACTIGLHVQKAYLHVMIIHACVMLHVYRQIHVPADIFAVHAWYCSYAAIHAYLNSVMHKIDHYYV